MINGQFPIRMKVEGTESEQYFSYYNRNSIQHDFVQSIYKLFGDEVSITITDADFCIYKFSLEKGNGCGIGEKEIVITKTDVSECQDRSECGVPINPVSTCDQDGSITLSLNISSISYFVAQIYFKKIDTSNPITSREDLFKIENLRSNGISGNSSFNRYNLGTGLYAIGGIFCEYEFMEFVEINSCKTLEYTGALNCSVAFEKPSYNIYDLTDIEIIFNLPSEGGVCDGQAIIQGYDPKTDNYASHFKVNGQKVANNLREIDGLCQGDVVEYVIEFSCEEVKVDGVMPEAICYTADDISFRPVYRIAEGDCSTGELFLLLDENDVYSEDHLFASIESILIVEEDMLISKGDLELTESENAIKTTERISLNSGVFTVRILLNCGRSLFSSFQRRFDNGIGYVKINNCNCKNFYDIFCKSSVEYKFKDRTLPNLNAEIKVYQDGFIREEIDVVDGEIKSGNPKWTSGLEGDWNFEIYLKDCEVNYTESATFARGSRELTGPDIFYSSFYGGYVTWGSFVCDDVCSDLNFAIIPVEHSGDSRINSLSYATCGADNVKINPLYFRPAVESNPCAGGSILTDNGNFSVLGGFQDFAHNYYNATRVEHNCNDLISPVPCIFQQNWPNSRGFTHDSREFILAWPCREAPTPSDCVEEIRQPEDNCLLELWCTYEDGKEEEFVRPIFDENSVSLELCRYRKQSSYSTPDDIDEVRYFCQLTCESISTEISEEADDLSDLDPESFTSCVEMSFYCDCENRGIPRKDCVKPDGTAIVSNPILLHVSINPDDACFTFLNINEDFKGIFPYLMKSWTYINSGSKVTAESDVTFSGKERVTLNHPFRVESGSHFKAMIEGCELEGNATAILNQENSETEIKAEKIEN